MTDTATAPQEAAASEDHLAVTQPKMRRRPIVAILCVLVVVLGAIITGYAVSIAGGTTSVVAVRTDIARGELITRSALQTVNITLDPSLSTVPGDQIDTLVGKHARVDLHAGGLISPDSITSTALPAEGQSVIGIAAGVGQRPSAALRPGDHVRIVATPRDQDDPPAEPPTTIEATVVAVHDSGDPGLSVIDVSVARDKAAVLAALVATGRIAIILDGS